MSFITNANAAPRAFFVTGADRDAHVGVLAGPYLSPVEAGSRMQTTRDAAKKRGLLSRFRVLAVAEGPEDMPTFLGPI